MALPTNIYDVIDPPGGVIAEPAWLGVGWGNKFRQPCVFYLGGVIRLMTSLNTVYAVQGGQQVTLSSKYRDYLDAGLVKKGAIAPDEVKSFFAEAIGKYIPASWINHPDFSALNWRDQNLSCEQISRVLDNNPTSFIKCCQIMAVISAFIEKEKMEPDCDPRLRVFNIADEPVGLRIMPAIYVIDGFDAGYYGRYIESQDDRLTRLNGVLRNPGSMFFEHVVKNRLPVTYKTAVSIHDFCMSEGLPRPGFVRATAKIALTSNGNQPRFKSASGERPVYP